MKLIATIIDGTRKRSKTILIDSGDGPLEARMSKVLPGYVVIGVFTYPALQEINLHVRKEEL